MKKQMIAERARRGEFIIAEGNKTVISVWWPWLCSADKYYHVPVGDEARLWGKQTTISQYRFGPTRVHPQTVSRSIS